MKSYGLADGLPSTFVEFDGERFRRYHGAHGLPERLILELAEERDQNLWIASLAGVVKLGSGGFVTYDANDGLTATRIHALFEDASGQLFVVGGTWIVSRFDGRRFVSVQPHLSPDRPHWGAQLAFLDRRNAWWIVGETALARYPPGSRLKALDGRPPTRVYPNRTTAGRQRFDRLFEDARGDIWWSAIGDTVDSVDGIAKATRS